jgi:hypothetical protein
MYVQCRIKTYSVNLTNFKLPYAYIMLFSDDGKWRVRLNFVPLPEVNEVTDVSISGDFIELYMNISLLDDVVNLLRNEKPITATANSDNDIFILSCGEEPVGEEEGRQLSRVLTLQRGPLQPVRR